MCGGGEGHQKHLGSVDHENWGHTSWKSGQIILVHKGLNPFRSLNPAELQSDVILLIMLTQHLYTDFKKVTQDISL